MTVLEARPRVGGRVHTLYSPFTHGLDVEAGGESIDDNHVQIQALARHDGLALDHRPTDKLQNAAFYRAGRRNVLGAVSGADPEALTGYVAFGDALIAMAGDLDLAHPEHAPQARAVGQTVTSGLCRHPNPRSQRRAPGSDRLPKATTTPNSTRCPYSLCSNSLWWTKPCRSSGAENDLRIAAGNSALPEAMARGTWERR